MTMSHYRPKDLQEQFHKLEFLSSRSGHTIKTARAMKGGRRGSQVVPETKASPRRCMPMGLSYTEGSEGGAPAVQDLRPRSGHGAFSAITLSFKTH